MLKAATLLPTLRAGDVVIMDNLRVHKTAGAVALIKDAGAEVRFLPPYSPDLNPIEKMWSKVKTLLRKAAARTHEKLLEAIAAALDAVTPENAANWFASCGYNKI
ncbi:MAG: transposase [Verrucomicrobiota bacterium]